MAELQAHVAQLQGIVTQQAHVLATANLAKNLAPAAPAAPAPAAAAVAETPAAAGGTKRGAEGEAGEQEAKRQEVA